MKKVLLCLLVSSTFAQAGDANEYCIVNGQITAWAYRMRYEGMPKIEIENNVLSLTQRENFAQPEIATEQIIEYVYNAPKANSPADMHIKKSHIQNEASMMCYSKNWED